MFLIRSLKKCFACCVAALALSSHAFALEEELPLIVQPALVMESDSGKILVADRAFVRWAPASLTKLMTAYAVFRQVELGHVGFKSPVRVSEEALAQPPSKMGLPIGTIMTVETALSILMVKSANDIAVALGQSIAGSEEQFVGLMNSHARRLGMKDTQFRNPHGLHDDEQFTTARDMAVLAQTISKEFEKYDYFFNIPAVRIGNRRLRNHNALLEMFAGTNGMKTGYVCASGFNVVVRTEREGRELIAVVFGGASGLERNVRAAKLLEESFANTNPATGLNLSSMIKPSNTSQIPVDITPQVCPWKFTAIKPTDQQPTKRPEEAPKSGDFDAIDTQLPPPDEDEAKVEKVEEASLPAALKIIPTQRSSVRIASTFSALADTSDEDEAKTPAEPVSGDDKLEAVQDLPPTLKELADVYLTPRVKFAEDMSLSLNGATGPNPNGIKLTNGGRYVAPIPVPEKKP